MPDNHRIALTDQLVRELEDHYYFVYDEDTDEVITKTKFSSKETRHSAQHTFSVNAKKYGKKVTFNKEVLDLWKNFRTNKTLSTYSLFAVNNAYSKLKIMYQQPDVKNMTTMLLSKNLK